MLPNQVKNAIPRQKVKNKRGHIGTVVAMRDENTVLVMYDHNPPNVVLEWSVYDCEPVPEEPRGFRCGDKVCIMREGLMFTTVDCVADNFVGVVSGGSWDSSFGVGGAYDLSYLRHATPEEIARYF